MKTSYLILVLLSPLALFACATSEGLQTQYDPSTDRSSFTSDRIVMGYRDLSAGLVSNQRVMWQALASCPGQACTPDEITLVFFNDTSRDLNLDYRRLQVTIDGTTFDWQDLGRELEPANYAVPRGEFTRVSIARSVFVRLAEAQWVEVIFGESGTSVFYVPYDRRAGFRAFIAALDWDD